MKHTASIGTSIRSTLCTFVFLIFLPLPFTVQSFGQSTAGDNLGDWTITEAKELKGFDPESLKVNGKLPIVQTNGNGSTKILYSLTSFKILKGGTLNIDSTEIGEVVFDVTGAVGIEGTIRFDGARGENGQPGDGAIGGDGGNGGGGLGIGCGGQGGNGTTRGADGRNAPCGLSPAHPVFNSSLYPPEAACTHSIGIQQGAGGTAGGSHGTLGGTRPGWFRGGPLNGRFQLGRINPDTSDIPGGGSGGGGGCARTQNDQTYAGGGGGGGGSSGGYSLQIRAGDFILINGEITANGGDGGQGGDGAESSPGEYIGNGGGGGAGGAGGTIILRAGRDIVFVDHGVRELLQARGGRVGLGGRGRTVGYSGAAGGGGKIILNARHNIIERIGGEERAVTSSRGTAAQGETPGEPTVLVFRSGQSPLWKRDHIYTNGQLTATVENER